MTLPPMSVKNLWKGIALTLVLIPVAGLAAGSSLNPSNIEGPVAESFAVTTADQLPVMDAGKVDIHALRSEEALGEAPQFADPLAVLISPETHGVWEELDDRYQIWQLRINSPGALSLNFGFSDFELPKGGRLTIYPADMVDVQDKRGVRVFTEIDNRPHRELWTPVVVTDDVILELVLPTEARHDYSLDLGQINRGFRFLGEDVDKSGFCNIDVICPEGDPWWNEINSVGVYTINGTWFCSGAVVNNTAQDQTQYFLTANHCNISTSNDQGVVIYWNFQSPICGDLSGGSLDQFSSGVTYLASSSTSDFCLVLVNDPFEEDFHVSYSGWDRSGNEIPEAVAIHHPSTDEKSISFEFDPTTTTSYLDNAVPGDGTHFRITDWDLGTTEGGSSGSPLYDPDHRIVGQLHGGYASCTSQTSDWYGKFSITWPNLSQWLDPLNTGAVTLDTFNPFSSGMSVSTGNLECQGDSGGPFNPDSKNFILSNLGTNPLPFSVSADVDWVDIEGGNGTIQPDGLAVVIVRLNDNAYSFPDGNYSGTLFFSNLDDGVGDAVRGISLTVGEPVLIYSETMADDPGWSGGGDWAHGIPTGGGGEAHGNPDPTSGHTGSNVLGYNLAGDYPDNLPEMHLTSLPFDCTDLAGVTLKFWRFLNVESPTYDHASISVSIDATNFIQIWANNSEITDDTWVHQEFDISAMADGQAVVYLRWTMGETDGSYTFSGWNIDDVEIWAMDGRVSSVGETPAFNLAVGNYPNPFNPVTKIEFTLERAGKASLQVYNLQGRLVRTLVDQSLGEGAHSIVWDGTDRNGQKVASGVYFARLTSADQVAEHKMVLLK